MRDFLCPSCGQHLTFESSRCLSCGNKLAFDPWLPGFLIVSDGLDGIGGPGGISASGALLCANEVLAACNWVAVPGGSARLCTSCALTRTRPADDDLDAMPAFVEAETAKRRLVLELIELGLPIRGRSIDPVGGLGFDLLSSRNFKVTTGHADGIITLDLAEGDDVHREQLRVSMAEPYRTLVGHFRHEIGHYYFSVLVRSDADKVDFEALFGDPDTDYQIALERHYSQGPPPDWHRTHLSAYASMHPAEDWAETFAHYLHIRDALDTAAAFAFAPAGVTLATPLTGAVGFGRILELWLPLAWSLNMINRSMGHSDLYPFVLPPAALTKLRMVHRLVSEVRPA